MSDQVRYAEMTPREFKTRLAAAPIAYLPLGTLEWHGEHLPLGADGLQAEGFFVRLARRAGGVVLPMLFLGPDRMQKQEDGELYGMDFYESDEPVRPLAGSAYWVPDETFQILLEATFKQLQRAGFKILVAHGHGPSTQFFAERAETWRQRFGLQCFHCRHDQEEEGFGIMVDHAAMNETSLLMALRPDLVQMQNLPADPRQRLLGVAGKDPRVHAGADLGRRILDAECERMAKILEDALGKV